ncbi:MAG: MarR family winged helix-turn-helix transcriptional regulator [Pseudomonadota bacterium]
MTKMPQNASPSDEEIERLRRSVHLLIRALLVSGRAGAPAEGKLPFNPLTFQILGLLRDTGPMRPSAIAAILNVPRTTLSTASKALQARGIIEQLADPDDGRAQILKLSVGGADVAEAIKRQDRRNMETLLHMIDPKRRRVVVDVLDEISSVLNSQPS